ncbi:hypothetical protein ABZ654_25510 [Streptomyces hygroscopicus]
MADVFASVPRKDQRAKSDCCLRGLLADGRRESIRALPVDGELAGEGA